MNDKKCRHGYSLDGCELGFPGCVCADELFVDSSEAMDEANDSASEMQADTEKGS